MMTSEAVRTPTASHFSPDLKMMSSPSMSKKGKQREDVAWHLGWWDFMPLVKGNKPPIQWTTSSTIMFAHPTEPRVVCFQYPSNREISIPVPPLCLSSPSSYAPPSIIVGSSRDSWLFAYFPGVDADGLGCLWKRASEIDNWIVKDCWTFPKGGGVVTARWIQTDREWVTSESGIPTRLPSLGPFLPLVQPVLILVTESHLCNVYYLHPQTETMKAIGASLCRKSLVKEGDNRPDDERVEGPTGLGLCERATIGFAYDEFSIVVATHSTFMPTVKAGGVSNPAVDVSIPLSVVSSSEQEMEAEWDSWRIENVIELCQVTISIHNFSLSMTTNPLLPLRNFPSPGLSITDMVFIPSLPSSHNPSIPTTPTQTHRHITPASSPAISNSHVMQSPGRGPQRSNIKGTPPKSNADRPKGKGVRLMYLLCTTVDTDPYSGKIKSEITLFHVRHDPMFNDPMKQYWICKRGTTYTAAASVVMHVSPFQSSNSPQFTGVIVGTLNMEGSIRSVREVENAKRSEVGKFQLMRLPELLADEAWDPSKIVTNMTTRGLDLPFGVAISPNHTLIATISWPSSLPSASTATSFHSHPVKSSFSADNNALRLRKQIANSLGVAMQKRGTSQDIQRVLALPTTHITAIEEILSVVLHDAESSNNGSQSIAMYEIIGVAVEIYRHRGNQTKSAEERNECFARSSVGQDLCSMMSCVRAWDGSVEGDAYDLDAIWHLVGLSGWTVELLEKILKEATLCDSECFLNESHTEKSNTPNWNTTHKHTKVLDDPFIQSDVAEEIKKAKESETYFTLFHALHPLSLDLIIGLTTHVSKLRAFLSSIRATSDKAQMAKEVLLDVLDSSGIDLDMVVKHLSEVRQDVRKLADNAPDLSRRCLASLRPLPIQRPLLLKAITLLSKSADKVKLFIKPDDLVDSMLDLTMTSMLTSNANPDRDVVTKGFLSNSSVTLTCTRCNGKRDLPNPTPGLSSLRWKTWHKMWISHCICGGLWMRP